MNRKEAIEIVKAYFTIFTYGEKSEAKSAKALRLVVEAAEASSIASEQAEDLIISFLKKVREECKERRCEGILCKSEARYWKDDELNAYVKKMMEGKE